MLFCFVFGLATLLLGIFFVALVIRSKNPNNLIRVTAVLTHQKGFKNYQLKNRSVPSAVEYTYTYHVNGKPYHFRGVQLTHRRNLPKRAEIVCLRGFPRCAYEGHFSGVLQQLLAISFVAMGAFFLLLCFFI